MQKAKVKMGKSGFSCFVFFVLVLAPSQHLQKHRHERLTPSAKTQLKTHAKPLIDEEIIKGSGKTELQKKSPKIENDVILDAKMAPKALNKLPKKFVKVK